MIKAKVSTDYKDIERIFTGGSIQKEILKVWSTEADAYVFEAWRVLEMEGPLPLSIRANGEPLIDYRIYGNTEQTGTSTPENPIMPIGCGERFDITGLIEPLCGIDAYTDSLDLSTGILTRRIKKLVLTGKETWKYQSAYTRFTLDLPTAMFMGIRLTPIICTHYISIDDGRDITSIPNNAIYIGGSTALAQLAIKTDIYTTLTEWKSYLADQYAAGTPVTIWYVLEEPDVSTISIPSGLTGTIEGYLIQDGTPTPEAPIYPTADGVKQADGTYSIPYGYKLPILSNSTVTNIYLGEVETTRRIKKLVLTGEETWQIFKNNPNVWQFYVSDIIRGLAVSSCMSNITEYGATAITRAQYDYGTYSIESGAGIAFQMRGSKDTFVDVNIFKSYLAAQYAAGTPVTVWYVLAEPETGIVNEPLMKLGDYADTVDMEQAGVSIPTNKGTTVIDYDGEEHLITSDGYELVDKNQNGFLLSGSTLRPSKMYIKYKGR